MACSCDLKGIGVFSSSEIKDANELLGTFGADPGQENIFCCGYSLSLLLLYKKKTKHTQQKNSFSGVSYCRESALQIRAVPPVFTPFIFRGAEWNDENRPQKWAPAVLINRMGSRRVNTESHWSTLVVVCSFARGRWEIPGAQEICSNNRTT